MQFLVNFYENILCMRLIVPAAHVFNAPPVRIQCRKTIIYTHTFSVTIVTCIGPYVRPLTRL